MKRVFALLLCLILTMVALASCVATDSQGGDGHTHTFETEWSKDSEGHWYEATCDCEDLEPSKLAHVDANNDGACDLCTFTDHTHEYETETWTVNCTQHWHAATCGHVVVGIDAADHADENADGKCDVCNYVIEDIHQHVYDDEWTYDEDNHWHAALCEHKVEVADSEPHTIDAAGYCTVCGAKVGEIDKADFLAVLTAAMARNHKVVDASIIANQTVYGGSAGSYDVESYLSNEVYFVLGNGYSYIFDKTFDQSGFVGADEYWFEQTGEDSVFGVSKRFGDYKLTPASGEMQFLNGYNYVPGSILPSASDDTSTLANLIYLLYGRAIATDGLSVNAEESYNAETGVYSFSFTCYNINIVPSSQSGDVLVEVELYNAAVEFTVDDNLVIDNAKITVEVYRDFEADSDLTYTVSTDAEGNTTVTDIQLKATANPSVYDYVVSQRSGERTFTTPYPRASLIPQSFEFSLVTKYEFDEWSQYVILEEAPVGDSLTVTEGAYLNLHVGDPYPMTASFDFMTSGDFSYSFVNKDPNSTAKAWDANDTLLNGYSSYNNCLKIKILEPGEYAVTITFGDIVKAFDLIVESEQAPDIGEDDANTVNVAVTDTYGFFDLYSYTATEEGTYTFTLPANLALWSKVSYDAYGNPEVDLYDNAEGGATVEVALNAGEKYEFYVGSINKGAYVIGVSFVAGEVGGDEPDVPGGDDPIVDEGITGDGSEATPYVVAGEGSVIIAASSWTPLFVTVKAGVTATIEGGAQFYTDLTDPSATAGTTVSPEVDTVYYIFADSAAGATCVLYSTVGGSSGGGDDDNNDYNTTIVEGSNILYFSAGEVSADSAIRPLIVTADGNYKLAAGNLFIASITDANGNVFTRNDDYTYTLTAGEYTVSFGMLSMFGVAADQACTLNVTCTTSEGGDDIGGGETTEPDGTTENPFSGIPGDYVCAFPGGWDNVWYSSTAITGGYLTVSSDFASAYICVGINDPYNSVSNITGYDADGNAIIASSVTVYVPAGAVYYIGISDNDSNAVNIAFNVSFEAFISDDYSHLVGNWAATTTDNFTFKLTINADATGTYSENYGWGETVYNIDYIVVDGDTVIIGVSDAWSAMVITATYADGAISYAPNSYDPVIVFTPASDEGGDEGDDDVSYDTTIVEGANTLYFSADEVSADSATRPLIVTADGNYKLAAGNLFVAGITDASGNAIAKNDDYTFTLTAGEYTVSFGMLSMFGVAADQACELNVTCTTSEEEEEPVADGTFANPYELGETNELDFAGGWNYVFYVYTAPVAGTLTINVTSDDFYWGFGAGEYALENVGTVATADITLAAGEVIYIGMSTNSSNAGIVTFTATFTEGGSEGDEEPVADGTFANPFELGETNAVEFAGGWNYLFYVYTAPAAGTLTINVTSDDFYWGFGASEYALENVSTVATADITLMAGEVIYIGMSTNSANAGTITFTATFTEGGAPAGDGNVSYDTVIVEGANILYFSADEVSADSATRPLTVTAEGNYKLAAGNLFIAGITDASGNAITRNDDYTYTLVAGEYTVSFGMLSMFGVAADQACELNVSYEAIVDNDSDSGLAGAGTSADPYVIESIPYTITLSGKHDVYYVYTSSEAVTLVITHPEGCYVSGLANYSKDDANLTYTVTVAAGETVTINPWTNSTSGEFVYTVAVSEPTTDEGGEDEGGESTGVTYLTTHANGRKLQVVIDAAAGTMTITRSDLTGSLTTGGASVAEYTYAFADGVVTYTLVSGNNCTLVFDANGAPTSVTWGSATYTDFVQQ